MEEPRASRIAVLSVGSLLATLACLAVGLLLDRTLQRDAAATEIEARRVVTPPRAPSESESEVDGPVEDVEVAEPRP